MSRKSGATGLSWTNGKQHTLASVGILALAMGLLALALAIVVVVVVMPLVDREVSPGTAAGVEAVSARSSALGEPYGADPEGSGRVYIAKATESGEAFARSVALTGQSPAGYAVAGPCSAPICTLSMGPAEAKAYVACLALAAQVSDEAFVRSVALTGQNLAGYAVAGPCRTQYCTLSMGPAEAEAYVASLALAAQVSDEAFVRSVALTGQSPAGYAVAGPCNAPICTLSMGPAETEAYVASLALAAQVSDEAFVRSVALTGQSLVGYAVAGPCSSPICTLSMSPTEAEAYAASLALVAQVSGEAFVRSVALTGQNLAGYAVAGPCSAPYCTLSMSPAEAEAYAASLALVAQVSDEAFVRSVALTGQNLVGYAVAGPCSAPYCTLSMSPTEAEAYARSVLLAGQGSAGMVGGQ